jgi:DNA-binding MarR family transcriptional regulator
MAARNSNSKAIRPSALPRNARSADLAIDFDRYIPTVLSSLVAKLRANSTVFFAETYGVSLAEWRILSFLREHGPCSAYDIWTKANLDKAVVSRETGALLDKGFVKIVPVKGSARHRSEIRLSETGIALLERSFDEIVRRHDNLIAGLDQKSIETFLRVVDHLEERIAHMGEKSTRPYSSQAPIKQSGANTRRNRP